MCEERTLAAYGLEPEKPVFTIAAGSQRKPLRPRGECASLRTILSTKAVFQCKRFGHACPELVFPSRPQRPLRGVGWF